MPSTPQCVHLLLIKVIQFQQRRQPSQPLVQCCKVLLCSRIYLLFHVSNEQVGHGFVSFHSFSKALPVEVLVSLVHNPTSHSILSPSRCPTILLEGPLHESLYQMKLLCRDLLGIWRKSSAYVPLLQLLGDRFNQWTHLGSYTLYSPPLHFAQKTTVLNRCLVHYLLSSTTPGNIHGYLPLLSVLRESLASMPIEGYNRHPGRWERQPRSQAG